MVKTPVTVKKLRRVWSLFSVVTVLSLSLVSGVAHAQAISTLTSMQRESAPPPASQGSAGASAKAAPEGLVNLKLAPGFLLNIQVVGEPDMSSTVRLDAQGNVSLPLIGTMHAAGLTSTELERAADEKYLEKSILTDPQVNVNVVEYASNYVTVSGEVSRTGRFEVLAPLELLDLLSMAGGQTPMASDTIEITDAAHSTSRIIKYKRDTDPAVLRTTMVSPGESVVVRRAGIIYVLGAVTRPGGYLMQEDGELTVDQALAMAQGLVLEAKVHTGHIIRRRPDGTYVIIPFDFLRISRGQLQDLKLQPQDILFVEMSKPKIIFSQLKTVLSSAASAFIYVYR